MKSASIIDMNKKEKNEVFRYEYLEDEELVKIFANDQFITELMDENGDPEFVFNWFVNAYSKTNHALGYTGYINWKDPETVPTVEKGSENLYWIAVRITRHRDTDKEETKTVTFLANYQNRPLEMDDAGDIVDDDNLVSIDGQAVHSVGWISNKAHEEFENYYTLLDFSENYKLLGWAEYQSPSFTGEINDC